MNPEWDYFGTIIRLSAITNERTKPSASVVSTLWPEAFSGESVYHLRVVLDTMEKATRPFYCVFVRSFFLPFIHLSFDLAGHATTTGGKKRKLNGTEVYCQAGYQIQFSRRDRVGGRAGKIEFCPDGESECGGGGGDGWWWWWCACQGQP